MPLPLGLFKQSGQEAYVAPTPGPTPPTPPNSELREDGSFELREDGGTELRE